MARTILDGGGERTYITSGLRDELSLRIVKTELLQIKTFGGTECYHTSCNVVQIGVGTKDDVMQMMHALAIPFICNPIHLQSPNHTTNRPLQ